VTGLSLSRGSTATLKTLQQRTLKTLRNQEKALSLFSVFSVRFSSVFSVVVGWEMDSSVPFIFAAGARSSP
jgi:hypothetical protein